MSEKDKEKTNKLKLIIPTITSESETQTNSHLVIKTPENNSADMDSSQGMSIRKRRNISKIRGQATRQREKTPEPGRTPVAHEDTTTSDDEDIKPALRNSREIEADNTYEEMRRLVQEQANAKDPVYDLDTDEVLEARAMAANERRRRSISPFALPDKEEMSKLERKGSFIDPTNKLLSSSYTLTPKDDDSNRRSSLTIETPRERKNSLSPPTSVSPKDKDFPFPLPTTPKKLEEIVYPDEVEKIDKIKKSKAPVKTESEFPFDKKQEKRMSVSASPKTPETPHSPGELVTKVIEIERTPSKKLLEENKPKVEVRERIVRTPSRKSIPESKPVVVKQMPSKQTKDDTQMKLPPVKPARSKSASRFGGKTSESEMSEDQTKQHTSTSTSNKNRKVMPTPRRFIKNKSPKAKRSHSMHRVEDLKVVDKTATGMSQTSREIIELMQKARARSLSIPKDDPRLPVEYKRHSKILQTPNKTPATRSRGISCPKTIQIISDKEILSGLNKDCCVSPEYEKYSRQSSGYIDASQSEYTSSCYSTSPSENDYDFDLIERAAELTRKLNLLSEQVNKRDDAANIILSSDTAVKMTDKEQKSRLRKRSITDPKNLEKKVSKKNILEETIIIEKNPMKSSQSKWKLISNWQQFKNERKVEYNNIKLIRNRCISYLLFLVIMCGLGGIMFKSLEGSFENAYKCGSRNVKRDFIESLWRGSHHLREDDWKSMARKKLYEFENQLEIAFEAGVTSYSGRRSWSFMNSFVYCLTVITTIGYGHISPKTTMGRVATIIYAIVGIPLFLIVLADFGKLFTRIIKFFWAFIRRFYYTRSCKKVRRTVHVQEVMKGLNMVYGVVRRPSQIFNGEAAELPSHEPPPVERRSSDVPPPLPPKPNTPRDFEIGTEPETPAPSVFEIDDEFNLPISLAIIILIIYLIIGAVGYSMVEEWSVFESFYFVFISMSTIGLGDYVPSNPIFMMASIIYLVFGLALTSMCINVVQLKLSDTFMKASAKLGATIGLKVAEEDGSLVPCTPPPAELVPVHKPRSEVIDTEKVETDRNEAKNK